MAGLSIEHADLAMRLWCAVKRCSCEPGFDSQGGLLSCKCCADDLAVIEELGYVFGGEWTA